jgi:hypothetical protein
MIVITLANPCRHLRLSKEVLRGVATTAVFQHYQMAATIHGPSYSWGIQVRENCVSHQVIRINLVVTTTTKAMSHFLFIPNCDSENLKLL